MSNHFAVNPKLDFAIERFIDAPTRLVWEALTKPEHLKVLSCCEQFHPILVLCIDESGAACMFHLCKCLPAVAG